MKLRLRESVKGLVSPLTDVDNRRRIGVVSVVLTIGPASFLLGSNTK